MPGMTAPAWFTRPGILATQRVLAAVLGGYALCAIAVALLTVLLIKAGVPRSEAVIGCALSGFVLYLVVLIAAFSVRSHSKLWLGLLGASALMLGLLGLLR